MTIVLKILAAGVTAYLAMPVLVAAPAHAMPSEVFQATASVLPGSSCGWQTVKRTNGSTALELDLDKWLSKSCESDRTKFRIVPSHAVAQNNPVHVGCDYSQFSKNPSDQTRSALERTNELNRRCLTETAKMRQEFEEEKARDLKKQQDLFAAREKMEQAHKSVVDAQREMNIAYDEAKAKHAGKSRPAYEEKLAEYNNILSRYQAAFQDYTGRLAAYERLLASLV
tara:strand:+ start:984 stop:1661 length:678 start_codon:yes stop_codon:yes gene_type:complete